MKPVLLDQSSMFKAGLALSVGMLVVFCSGYYTGLQKAVPGAGLGLNKTIALALPRPAHANTAEFEQPVPLIQAPGADIDVDSPDAGITAASVDDKHAFTQANTVDSVIKTTTDTIEQAAVKKTAVADPAELQLASLTVTPEVLVHTGKKAETTEPGDGDQQRAAAQLQNEAAAANDAQITDTATAEDARYTIQVGVFADSSNAMRKMNELESLNLSAYTNGYTNKRDELRFNVRFGYFNNKSSATSALSIFENSMAGNGYVARIRRN